MELLINITTSVFMCLLCLGIGYFILKKSKKRTKTIFAIALTFSSVFGFLILDNMKFGENVIVIYDALTNESNLPVNVMNGNVQIIKNRMKIDLTPNRLYKLDTGKMALLHIAGTFNQVEIAKLLVGAGEDPKIIGYSNDDKPFINTVMSAANGKSLELIEYFISKGADVNFKNYDEVTPLHVGVQAANISVVKLLIEKGAIVDAKNRNGTTPLMIAIQLGKEDVAKALIAKGANPYEKDNLGNTLAVYGAAYPDVLRNIQNKSKK